MTTENPAATESVPDDALTTDPVAEAAWTGTPLLVDVRAGRHKNMDRLVFEFRGGRPGYHVEYVTELFQDGSGEPVLLRGRAILQILLQPAAAHDDDGNPTFTDGPPAVRDFAQFRQVADAGDFEGVLTWGIGLAGRTGVRVLTLSGPDRVAVDVAHVPPGTGNQLLRRGDSGAAVATWQWRLVQALGRDLRVDEAFGPATETATRDFQRAQRLAVDGIVGPRSRRAMEEVLGL
jgi:hypothetical protein